MINPIHFSVWQRLNPVEPGIGIVNDILTLSAPGWPVMATQEILIFLIQNLDNLRLVIDEQADLTLSTTRMGILALANGDSEKIAQLVTLENGDEALLKALCESMAAPELYFNVIEP